MQPLPFDPQWLSAAANAPLLAVIVWLMHHLKRGVEIRLAREEERGCAPHAVDEGLRAREELAAFKLEVARTYVPLSLIRDVDQRLTQHLLRIEGKLDEVSLAATATAAIVQQPSRGPTK
ncbi:hypothetical protein IAI18_22575 [Acetobacteraceae bacterium H6797]|nr:hypothetical protein [Acetobacteraceae bacterium H6797]